jgi:hypothetical protein
MIRSICVVIGCYVLMGVLIMGLFMAMWLGLGVDWLLTPGSYQGGVFLCVAAPSITVGVGLLGGLVCAKLATARHFPKPVWVLAGIVLILGGLMAAATLQKPFPADPRPAGMTMEQLMQVGREPTWLAIFNPLGGAAAVLLGGMVLGRPKRA